MSTFKKLINVKELSARTGINYQKLDNNIKGVSKSLTTDELDKCRNEINKAVSGGLDVLELNMLK